MTSNLVALIQGGSMIDVGVDNGIVTLDGSESYDPDSATNDNLVFVWTCEQVCPYYIAKYQYQ